MKTCPACQRTYDDALGFCQADGTPLVAAASPSPAPTPPVLPPPIPPALETSGAPAAYPPPAPPPPTPEYLREAPPSGLSNRTALFVVGALALLGLLGLGGYLLFVRPPELERKLYLALDQGNLVTPERYSAYELYHQLATDKPGSRALARATERVAPLVRSQTEEGLRAWAERSEATDDDWTRLDRLASWNAELAPQDRQAVAQQHYVRAQKAFRAGQTGTARSAFEEAIAAWPEWNLPYNSMGVTFSKARDYTSAAEWYARAAERSPGWSFPHANLGGAYYNIGRYDAAETALLKAISIDHSRPLPHLTLAGVYEKQGRYSDAIAQMETALQLDPDGTSGINVSRVQQRLSELQAYAYYY